MTILDRTGAYTTPLSGRVNYHTVRTSGRALSSEITLNRHFKPKRCGVSGFLPPGIRLLAIEWENLGVRLISSIPEITPVTNACIPTHHNAQRTNVSPLKLVGSTSNDNSAMGATTYVRDRSRQTMLLKCTEIRP